MAKLSAQKQRQPLNLIGMMKMQLDIRGKQEFENNLLLGMNHNVRIVLAHMKILFHQRTSMNL